MDRFTAWLRQQPTAIRATVLGGIAVAAVAVTLLHALVPTAAIPFVGAAAGTLLFVAALAAWHTLLPEERQQTSDLKTKYPLNQRRMIVGGLGVLWLIALLLIGNHLPRIIGGTLNVWAVWHLFWLFRPTVTEAAAQRAAYQAARAEAEEAKALARLEAELGDLGDLDKPGDPGHPDNR